MTALLPRQWTAMSVLLCMAAFNLWSSSAPRSITAHTTR